MDRKEDDHPKTMVRNKILTSYGLVIYTICQDQTMFLLTRRRDTFSYECILRGMYTPELLIEYVSNTTPDERRRLLSYEFDDLWKDLWVSTRRRLYRTELRKAKECWTQNISYIRKLVETAPREGKDIWDFPKGRRFVEETTHECALREFEEETTLSKDLVKIVNEAGCYEDNYQGTDHKMYRCVYYLGFIPNGTTIDIIYQPCPYKMRDPYISDEVMDIRWVNYSTAMDMITPTRRAVLERAYDFLQQ
jgi:8-oxo-dGTP pyrophosphatase MutT (NUDIX family)